MGEAHRETVHNVFRSPVRAKQINLGWNVFQQLNKDITVQECDASKAENSYIAWFTKK